MEYICHLKDINLNDIDKVGGKNASTGELIQNLLKHGIKVPGGFATTVSAYQEFMSTSKLDKKIQDTVKSLKTNNVRQLNKVSHQIRSWIEAAPFSEVFEHHVINAYEALGKPPVAVRSSATTEDSASASFAGQQETYLNIKGIKSLLKSIKLVYASLFTSRAIAYRQHQKFSHLNCALSVGVQPMVRSDKGASGVMFTLDTESGFDKVILINAAYGLGEAVVQGLVSPDEFYVYKDVIVKGNHPILKRKLGNKTIKMVHAQSSTPHLATKILPVKQIEQDNFSITDNDIQILAKQGLLIEKHYGKPMDIEWAKDGVTGEIFIVQARPETVKSQKLDQHTFERYFLMKRSKIITTGQSVGQRIAQGKARIILNPKQMDILQNGEILVTDMTDPDWEPIMRRAAAIVTNRGGRTCHAAIIARELGIPAIVGCVNATKIIKSRQPITVSCAEGETGFIYEGKLPFTTKSISAKNTQSLPVNLCLNVGNPDSAFQTQFLPNNGVGLARIEFIISHMIGIHPNAILNLKNLKKDLQKKIQKLTAAYKNPVEFYITKLMEGMSMIAAAFFPKEVIFRFSDFKSNEYANLLGGQQFEPFEENPMMGFRGASRYVNVRFKKAFSLECQAFKRLREEMGLLNAAIMIPFVRTINELKQVLALMASYGLKRGENQLKIYMMCEIPSNVILAKEFLALIDGFSIGSNDLTQLTLGLDRDSSIVADLFDERDAAVKNLLQNVIAECKKQNKYVGICGQGPSDYPDFARWLMAQGIHSISLNADTILETWMQLAKELHIIKTPDVILGIQPSIL